MGFRVQATALSILVYRTTGSALDLGIVSAIGAVPAVLCTVLGGVLADRYDTRIVWAVNSGLSASLIGLLGWLTFNDAVPIGQISLVVAVASPHRKEAFLACHKAVDRVKEIVPIWKKEVTPDGQYWVDDRP